MPPFGASDRRTHIRSIPRSWKEDSRPRLRRHTVFDPGSGPSLDIDIQRQSLALNMQWCQYSAFMGPADHAAFG